MDRTGGSAFPRAGFFAIGAQACDFDTHPREGMSLRDYFAAHAMVMLSNPATLAALRDEAKDTNQRDSELMALALYEVADAMLAEREK